VTERRPVSHANVRVTPKIMVWYNINPHFLPQEKIDMWQQETKSIIIIGDHMFVSFKQVWIYNHNHD
jgi:hypothetical protein